MLRVEVGVSDSLAQCHLGRRGRSRTTRAAVVLETSALAPLSTRSVSCLTVVAMLTETSGQVQEMLYEKGHVRGTGARHNHRNRESSRQDDKKIGDQAR